MASGDSPPRYVAAGGRALVAVALATLVASGLFLALAYTAAGIDKMRLIERLRAAEADGEFSRTIRPFLFRRSATTAVWGNNECMILYMLIAPSYQSRWEQTVSPRTPTAPIPDPCTGLRTYLAGEQIPDNFYQRYLHGYRVLTAALLALMPVSALPFVLLIGVHALCFALVIIAFARMRRANDVAEMHAPGGFLAIGIALLLFWGLAPFATSISYAFGDGLIVAMVLFFLLRNPLRMSEPTFLAACCAFGALDVWLEFLTGQTPLMLALIPGCLAISCTSESDGARLWPRIFGGLVAFAGTAVGCLVVKWAVAAATFGPEVASESLQHLFEIMRGPLQLPRNEVIAWLLRPLGLPTSYQPTIALWFLWPVILAGVYSPILGQGSYILGLGSSMARPLPHHWCGGVASALRCFDHLRANRRYHLLSSCTAELVRSVPHTFLPTRALHDTAAGVAALCCGHRVARGLANGPSA
jgi:hypothetical protein